MSWIAIILLILLGIGLLVLDFLVIPGILLTIVGLLFMAGGVVVAFKTYGALAGTITLIVTAVVLIAAVVFMLRSKVWKRLQLKTKIDSKVNEVDEKLTVGTEGVTISRLAPMGKAQFGDEMVEVSSPQDFIDENTPVVITKIDGNKIFVNPKN